MIKAILFDFDLTLIDSFKPAKKAMHDLLKEYDLKVDGFSQKEMWGSTTEEFAKRIAEINDNKMDWKEIRAINRAAMEKYFVTSKLYDIEFLKWLNEQGIKLGVISNNTAPVISDTLSNEYNKEVLFEIVLSSDNDTFYREKSEMILECLEKLEVKPSETMYVGDHPHDIEAAEIAGVISVAVSSGAHTYEELSEFSPDISIRRLSELKDYIISHGSNEHDPVQPE